MALSRQKIVSSLRHLRGKYSIIGVSWDDIASVLVSVAKIVIRRYHPEITSFSGIVKYLYRIKYTGDDITHSYIVVKDIGQLVYSVVL